MTYEEAKNQILAQVNQAAVSALVDNLAKALVEIDRLNAEKPAPSPSPASNPSPT